MMTECPNCGSKRATIGGGVRTAMYCQPFTDADGRRHQHDRNEVRATATCDDCGTKRPYNYRPGVCWCGWAAEEGDR